MSLERVTILDLDTGEQNELDTLLTQLAAKTPRNQLRSAYYDGKNITRHLGMSMPPSMNRVALVLGWPAKAVDILNRRCRLEKFYVPGVEDDLGLEQLWQDNYLDTEAPQAGVSSLIHAAAFVVTTQGDTQSGEPEVLVTARDALSGTGRWDRRRRALASFLSIIDTDDNGNPTEMVMYLPNLNVFMVKTAGAWTVTRREHPYGVPVEPLVYQPRLGRPFGSSRISRVVMSLNDSAVRTVMRSEVTAELYSVAQRILLGADESAFRNADGTIKSAWESRLASVWAIADDEDATNPRADVKEFSQASQQPHMDQLRSQAQLFAGETSIPISSLGLGAGEANPTSAASYEASREDIVSEAEGTIDGWGPAWRRSALRGLQMLNGWDEIPDEAKSLRDKWRNPRHASRAEAADAGTKQLSAVPWLAETEVGLELLGLDQRQIDRALVERRRMGGSAALRAISEAAAAGRPAVTVGADNFDPAG